MNNAGYDFSKLRNVKISRKRQTLMFVLLIIFFTPFLLVLTFYIMYLTGTPIHDNNIYYYPGEPEYELFYRMFLWICGGITLVLGLLIAFLSKRGGREVIYLTETLDIEKIIYFENPRKAVYISSKEMIVYDKMRDRLTKVQDAAKLQEERTKYIFWMELDQVHPVIKSTLNKVKIKYSQNNGSYSLKKVYTLKLNNSGQLSGFHETIYSYRYGNSNIKAYNDYRIEAENYTAQVPYHEKIRREMLASF